MNLRQLQTIARYQANKHNETHAIVKGIDDVNEVVPMSEYRHSKHYKFLWSFDPNKKDKV